MGTMNRSARQRVVERSVRHWQLPGFADWPDRRHLAHDLPRSGLSTGNHSTRDAVHALRPRLADRDRAHRGVDEIRFRRSPGPAREIATFARRWFLLPRPPPERAPPRA